MLDALERARPGAAALVSHQRDPAIEAIVETIPSRFVTPRALALGFAPADELDALIKMHMDSATD